MDCSECTEPFDQGERLPKVMPCGHTMCRSCVRQLSERTCPSCEKTFPSGEVLPINFTVLQLIQDRPDR